MDCIQQKGADKKAKKFLYLNMMMPRSKERHSLIRQECTWGITILVHSALLLNRQDIFIDSMRIMDFASSTSLTKYMPLRQISLGATQNNSRRFATMQTLDVMRCLLRNISNRACVTELSLQRNTLMMLRY